MKFGMDLEKGLDFQGFFSVVPAYAGVILGCDTEPGTRPGSPRIRGGDPTADHPFPAFAE